MKAITDKIKDPKTKAVLKSYARAVLASAVTMAMALSADLDPQYAVLIGSLTAPLVKWADKAEKEFGLVAKKKK
jgi:hypothetical protein